MSSLNQVNAADFSTMLEIYKKQELKLDEYTLLEEKINLEIEDKENENKKLKSELAEIQETLKKRKIEFDKFVKTDFRRCEVMHAELDTLKEVQDNQLKFLQENSEISKRQSDIVEKSRGDLKNYRKQFDSENLTQNINFYKEKIEELSKHQSHQAKSQVELLKKYEQTPDRSCPEMKFFRSLKKPSKSWKQVIDEQKKTLAHIQTIKEKQKELLQ